MSNRWVRALLLLLALLLLAFLVPSGTVLYDALGESVALPEGVAPIPLDAPAGMPIDDRFYLDDTRYEDPSLSIAIERGRYLETDYLVARVQLAHPSQLRTAVAFSYYSQQTLAGAQIANRANAVLAINGDYFSYEYFGYIVRQGKVWRERPDMRRDILIIDDKGDLHIIPQPDDKKVAAFGGVMVNTFNFGPGLVVNGEKATVFNDNSNATFKSAQRVALAQDGPLSYVCIVSEGPEDKGSVGLTIPQFADLVDSLGVDNAYNLDGGSSSTMVFRGKKINSLPKFRTVCDMVCFVSAYDGGAAQ